MRLLMLTNPSANRVYASQGTQLATAELQICLPEAYDVRHHRLAGVDYVGFDLDTPGPELSPEVMARIGRQSTYLALFEHIDPPAGNGAEPASPEEAAGTGLLRPIIVADPHVFDDDLLTIPKYYGKTNEQFTRLLLNLTLAAMERPLDEDTTVLDPLCGRGTTLTAAWALGLHGAGVEVEAKSVEQFAAFLKTYLRRKRIKHRAEMVPVRRDGKALGRKLEASAHVDGRDLTLGVFTGDTRSAAKLWGRKKFDAVVTDAPYGVVHGSRSDVVGTTGKRDRSPAGLLKGGLGVWASQLKSGGALGLSWNTLGLSREDLADMVTEAGLVVHDEAPWQDFAHRVDSSIHRDLLVATKPTD